MAGYYKEDPIDRENIGKYFPQIFDVFSYTAEGKYVFIMNIDSNYAYWSDDTVEYFGLSGNRIYNPVVEWGSRIEPHDREIFLENMDSLLSGKIDEHNLIYRIKNANGEYVTCSCRGKVVYGDNGERVYFAGTIVNHQRKATIDPVTGLYNRAGLFEYVNDLHRENKHYYLLMSGLKQFFKVNYSYGYNFGNDILELLADMWREVNEDGRVFRTEGTKMVLVFEADKYTGEDIGKKYLEILGKLKNGIDHNGCKVFLSIYACLYQSANLELDANTIYNCTLYAANKAKREERNELFMVFRQQIIYGKAKSY